MDNNIEGKIIEFMKKDPHREHTIPEIRKGIKIKNRTKVVAALAVLETKKKVSYIKRGRVKYYHLVS